MFVLLESTFPRVLFTVLHGKPLPWAQNPIDVVYSPLMEQLQEPGDGMVSTHTQLPDLPLPPQLRSKAAT